MATSSPLSKTASLDVPSRTVPPPLPPRQNSQVGPPPPYSAEDERGRKEVSEQWRSNDPRSSSTQSLRPSESARDGRRTLLLIYIHGFMGNEMSFQSFPAHVHNLLSILVSETHVLHTKIYPRYKSRKAIEFARDDFSEWLEPHETPTTDVVLLGHSMGGILAAEVALLPPHEPSSGHPFRHRILGTIGFDTPYLGMHPGVIVSGIGSLFRPAQKPPPFNEGSQTGSSFQGVPVSPLSASQMSIPTSPDGNFSRHGSVTTLDSLSPTLSNMSSISTIPSNDPYFDPPFPNDRRFPERSGWSSVLHFINKHADGLTAATKQYFMSHIEFGGCLADYSGLKVRYSKIRELEDVEELSKLVGQGSQQVARRIRFVNYWTASTGIPKKPQVSSADKDDHLKPTGSEMQDGSLSDSSSRSLTPTPSISVDEYSERGITRHDINDDHDPSSLAIKLQLEGLGENSGVQENESNDLPEMVHVDSMPIEEDEEPVPLTETLESPELGDPRDPVDLSDAELQRKESEPPLPPISPIPQEPEPIDLSVYRDKDSRKVAEKEQKRVMKAYQQAVKDRDNAIKDRKKLLEKRQKKARQEEEKQLKAEQKRRLKEENEEEKRQGSINPKGPLETPQDSKPPQPEKPKRDKKFCMLPSNVGGKRDKCWIRVYMEGVDEVGAHCGLFFLGPHYESLVGDVGARVEEWVKEDSTRRAVLERETESVDVD